MASSDSRAPQSMDGSPERGGQSEQTKSNASSKETSFLKRIWEKTGLNAGILIMMAKGALPPTLAIAIYQDTGFATQYLTLGYLVAIMAVISFAIMPRAKFIQTMVLNILATCIGAAIALLAIYCSVKARAHTSQPSSRGYNSSASAVSAIWLFANIYFVNTFRAARPQLQFPVIVYSIFANVAMTRAPLFITMNQGMPFAKNLLKAFLTGFAIAAVISLLFFPVTSRMLLLKQTAGFLCDIQGSLKDQAKYLQSLEREDMFGPASRTSEDLKSNKEVKSDNRSSAFKHLRDNNSSEAESLKAKISSLGDVVSKMTSELTYAKREIAYGKFDAADLEQIVKHSQDIFLPVVGMSSIADIFERMAVSRGWKFVANDPSPEKENFESNMFNGIAQWNKVMKALHDPFEVMTEAMSEGLQHVLYVLGFEKQPKKDKLPSKAKKDGTVHDVEAEGDIIKPGDEKFVAYLTKKVDKFYDQRKLTLVAMCDQKGINIDDRNFGNSPHTVSNAGGEGGDVPCLKENQRQLYLILYMEFLLWSTGQAVLHLVRFADLKVEEGHTNKNRIVLPGFKRLKKWVLGVLNHRDIDTVQTPDSLEAGDSGIYAGVSFESAKDPEHLPPVNSWERFSDGMRRISRFLASPASLFGFRTACATLTIGIIAYLKNTQTFFNQQRLVWAMIMVAIGMTTTAGSGMFGFFGRVTGTTIAMCVSLVCWYIVDGRTGGVIPLLWLFITIEFYFVIKFPRFIVVGILSIVTQILIIGYELEVRKLGTKVATSNGQPAYPIYLLAPYRLACVAGGTAVAFVWTFFPYPITERSQLRKELGTSLYLLANFYSIVHSTVQMRIKGEERGMDNKASYGRKLEKARTKVFTKSLALLTSLRQHSVFISWEPSFGGKFPKEKYDDIIESVQDILNYMALISYASKNFNTNQHDNNPPEQNTWSRDMVRLAQSINITSHEITSLLSMLSAAVTNGTPLPPYLKKPQSFRLSERLQALDADILSISHIAEPGYAAFAVMQIASSMIGDDLEKLIENVKSLVGEVDFSFHAISTATSSVDAAGKGKKD